MGFSPCHRCGPCARGYIEAQRRAEPDFHEERGAQNRVSHPARDQAPAPLRAWRAARRNLPPSAQTKHTRNVSRRRLWPLPPIATGRCGPRRRWCRPAGAKAWTRPSTAPPSAPAQAARSKRDLSDRPCASSAPEARSSSMRDASPVGRTSARTGLLLAASRRQISPPTRPVAPTIKFIGSNDSRRDADPASGRAIRTGLSTPAGSVTPASSLPFASASVTAISPLGCGIAPDTCVSLPRNGRIDHARKTGRRGIDAQHGAEELVIRAGSPGVAIRACGVGRFGPRGQAAAEHGAPGAQHVQIPVARARLVHGGVQVVAEINRALHQAADRRRRARSGHALRRPRSRPPARPAHWPAASTRAYAFAGVSANRLRPASQ